jgi:hypothetical protein
MMKLTYLPGGTFIVFALAVLFSAGLALVVRARDAVSPPRAPAEFAPAAPPP